MASLLMGIGFAVMSRKGVWIGCAALAVVWIVHITIFLFMQALASGEITYEVVWIVHITIFLFRVKTIDAAAN